MKSNELRSEIIDLIKKNRISTTEVADALGKKGSIQNVLPVNPGHHCVGRICAVYATGGSNYFVHENIKRITPGDIFLISTLDFQENQAIIGDLIARSVLLYSGAAAIVVEGNVRDYARLLRENYAIWSQGRNPVGAINSKKGTATPHPYDNGIAVCDDGGVVIIPPEEVSNQLLDALHAIEKQEDIWYFCLNTLKWSTFEIVCEKRYEIDSSKIPDIFKNESARETK